MKVSIFNILISNLPLPAVGIGSWTNRISHFNTRNDFFDYILSPTKSPNTKYIFCEKRKRIFPYILKNWQSTNWIAKDYLKFLSDMSSKASGMKIVVMDDLSLVSAIAFSKDTFKCKIELIFSFHGHLFQLPKAVGEKIDKILFLTHIGYQESLRFNETFTPEVVVVGNGVRSDLFFPLDSESRLTLKEKLGFNKNDEIILWMANSRPNKGLHLFLKLAKLILSKFNNVKILIIGNEDGFSSGSNDILALGKLNHDNIPQYLQITDYYFFTTLWKEGFGLSLVEAIKCGISVVASNNGGVKEVLSGYEDAFLVDEPNILACWMEKFVEARSKSINEKAVKQLNNDFSDFHSYENWERKFLKALE